MGRAEVTPENVDNCAICCPDGLSSPALVEGIAGKCRERCCPGPIVEERIADISGYTAGKEGTLVVQYSIKCGVEPLNEATFGYVPDDYELESDPRQWPRVMSRLLTQEEIRGKPVELEEWIKIDGR
jgi:hypothetical protein